jgi:ABC-2 type transport system permease protein
MRFIAIVRKSFYGWIRNPLALFFTFAFPAIFIIIFSLAFKRGLYSPERTFRIVVINRDTTVLGNGVNLSELWIKFLGEAKYPSGKPLFSVSEAESFREDIVKNLKRGKYSSIIEISPEFSDYLFKKSLADCLKELALKINREDFDKIRKKLGFFSYENLNLPTNGIIKIRGLEGSIDFTIVTQILRGILEGFSLSLRDSLIKRITEELDYDIEPPLNLFPIETFSYAPFKTTTFDYMVPGLMVFALIMMISGVSIGLITDFEFKQIRLLRLTRMREVDYLGGEVVVSLFIGIIQLSIMYGVAKLTGFHSKGSFLSIIPFALFAGIATGSVGLIIAALSSNLSQVTALSNLVGIILAFGGGMFYYLATPKIVGNFLGEPLEILDLLPWRHLSIILRTTLVLGESPLKEGRGIFLLVVESLVLFIISLQLYRIKKLRYLKA